MGVSGPRRAGLWLCASLPSRRLPAREGPRACLFCVCLPWRCFCCCISHHHAQTTYTIMSHSFPFARLCPCFCYRMGCQLSVRLAYDIAPPPAGSLVLLQPCGNKLVAFCSHPGRCCALPAHAPPAAGKKMAVSPSPAIYVCTSHQNRKHTVAVRQHMPHHHWLFPKKQSWQFQERRRLRLRHTKAAGCANGAAWVSLNATTPREGAGGMRCPRPVIVLVHICIVDD